MQEIGSEFWLDSNIDHFIYNQSVRNEYLLSGRTAIDEILNLITGQKTIRNVYFPAYCCDSMIQPFIDRGISVKFYDIDCEGKTLVYLIDPNYRADILYISNYFGYQTSLNIEILKTFKNNGSIVMYDQTHSLLLDNDYCFDYSDYSFSSIRKWCNVISGAVILKSVYPIVDEFKDCPYILTKLNAMKYKGRYLAGEVSIPKELFLNLFSEFNKYLSVDYHGYRMDSISYLIWKNIDLDDIKFKRRRNASILHSELNEDGRFRMLFDLQEEDTPLFVPLIFENKLERDRVRKILIDHKIYCPIHWPRPSTLQNNLMVHNIYDTELSLVCDQRYNELDMERLVSIIKKNR